MATENNSSNSSGKKVDNSANQELYEKEFEFFTKFTSTPDLNETKPEDSTHGDFLYKYLKKAHSEEEIHDVFKQFYDYFYNRTYEYDINGYNLILFNPPSFSAFTSTQETQKPKESSSLDKNRILDTYIRDTIMMAIDYTPHEISVSTSQIDLTSSLNFQYPTDTNHGGNISVTYLDTDDLRIYSLHSIWLKYIFYCNQGYLVPDKFYIESNTIDYLASIYSLKFKADMETPTLATKAMGVFPTSLPVKETLGVRGQHELTLTTVNYSTLYYMDEVIKNEFPTQKDMQKTNPIYDEITTLFVKVGDYV
jgi:hypothetical protein